MAKFNRRALFTLAGSLFSTSACKTVASSSMSSGAKTDAEYDYIIVGSGAGGGPLAVNLSKAGFKVLLLEAGTDQGSSPVYKVPAWHTQSTEAKDMAWDFYVNHFKNIEDDKLDSKFVAQEKGILYPRSGTLGGCTAHNAMITVYPLRRDWTQLCDDTGDKGFSPEIMRKYFQFTENAQYTGDANRKKGWLPVQLANPLIVVKDTGVIAMVLSGLRSFDKSILRHFSRIRSAVDLVTMPDMNRDEAARDEKEGLVMIPTATTAKGQRYSTRDLIMNNRNDKLTLRTDCLVTRVLFDEGSVARGEPEAIGVEYILGNRIYQASKSANPPSQYKTSVYAKKEVILAGGTFNTPQILMNSGIGPKDDLEKFENGTYQVILDRPGVGRNLQDRYEVGVVTETSTDVALVKDCKFKPEASDPCYKQWEAGLGPYTTNGGVIGILKKSRKELKNPDLFIFLLPVEFQGYYPGYSKAIADKKNRMTWCILKSHTSNRGGRVMIESLDPTVRPKINFHYFQDGTDASGKELNGNKAVKIDDLEAVTTAIEYVRGIVSDANSVRETLETGDIISGLLHLSHSNSYKEVIPGPKVESRDQIREWVRKNSWGHHACGTCKMGKVNDPMAVVDSKFRVIGTKGLRIVDASIFPRIPGYFIVSSIYALSEKASDDILADVGVPRRIKG